MAAVEDNLGSVFDNHVYENYPGLSLSNSAIDFGISTHFSVKNMLILQNCSFTFT